MQKSALASPAVRPAVPGNTRRKEQQPTSSDGFLSFFDKAEKVRCEGPFAFSSIRIARSSSLGDAKGTSAGQRRLQANGCSELSWQSSISLSFL